MTQTLPPQTMIGKVELYVADLDRALHFYQGALGFQLQGRQDGTAALGAVGGSPLVVLNARPGARPAPKATGLYHFAVLLPNRKALARLLYQLANLESEVLQGAADHGVSEALYLADPDGNGIEVYVDRRRSEWPRDDLGRLQMGTEELNIDDLLMELKGSNLNAPWEGLPEGTTVGHIHLKVSDLSSTERFYRDVLGFDLVQRYGSGALFFSAGGYHHHIGANTWTGVGAPPPPADAAGLRWFELLLPDLNSYNALMGRLEAAGIASEAVEGGLLVRDPSQNTILVHHPVS